MDTYSDVEVAMDDFSPQPTEHVCEDAYSASVSLHWQRATNLLPKRHYCDSALVSTPKHEQVCAVGVGEHDALGVGEHALLADSDCSYEQREHGRHSLS